MQILILNIKFGNSLQCNKSDGLVCSTCTFSPVSDNNKSLSKTQGLCLQYKPTTDNFPLQ